MGRLPIQPPPVLPVLEPGVQVERLLSMVLVEPVVPVPMPVVPVLGLCWSVSVGLVVGLGVVMG